MVELESKATAEFAFCLAWVGVWQQIQHWVPIDTRVLGYLVLASAVFFFGSLIATPWLIAQIPADYFVRKPVPLMGHPVRMLLRGLKNLCGGVLILAGIAMILLPGQGILTIVVGVLLVDFPGKRRVEIWLLTRRRVPEAVNWIRKRFHREPLCIPADPPHVTGPATRDGTRPPAE